MTLVIYKHSASCFKNSICIARKETLCVIAFNEIESLLVLVFRHLVNYNITCAVVVILLQRTTEPPIRHGILSLKNISMNILSVNSQLCIFMTNHFSPIWYISCLRRLCFDLEFHVQHTGQFVECPLNWFLQNLMHNSYITFMCNIKYYFLESHFFVI